MKKLNDKIYGLYWFTDLFCFHQVKIIFLSLALICPIVCCADNNYDRHRISLKVGISTEDTYDYGAGYHFIFCKNIGVGARIGVWSFFPDGGILGETEEERSDRENFFFEPSVILISPDLFSIKNCTFHLECEPSLMISTRQYNTARCGNDNFYVNYRTDCLSWHCDAAFGARYRNVNFMLYCAISNLDIKREYKCYENNSYSKKLISSFGVKISVNF